MKSKLAEIFGGIMMVLGTLIVLAMIAFGIYHNHKQEQKFKSECVAVAGRVVYDDNELECHKNGYEIAEFGENSPNNPVWNDRVG